MQILFVGFLKISRFTTAEISSPKNKFGMKTTEEYYKHIQNECEDFVLCNGDVTTVNKILKNLDVAKGYGIDQISAKFLRDSAPVITIHLTNIINVSIKLKT